MARTEAADYSRPYEKHVAAAAECLEAVWKRHGEKGTSPTTRMRRTKQFARNARVLCHWGRLNSTTTARILLRPS